MYVLPILWHTEMYFERWKDRNYKTKGFKNKSWTVNRDTGKLNELKYTIASVLGTQSLVHGMRKLIHLIILKL